MLQPRPTGGGGGDVPLQSLCPDATADHLSTCTRSVRVRKRTEGSTEALPPATAAPSSASENSALLSSDHRMFKPLASPASRTPGLRVPVLLELCTSPLGWPVTVFRDREV